MEINGEGVSGGLFERLDGLPPGRYVERAFAAEEFGVAPRTIRRWEGQGGFPHSFEVGRKRCFLAGDLQEWLRTRCKKPGEPDPPHGRKGG